MGRQRAFDIDQAVGIAADMFYRRGYDGTSISDLTAAIGIGAPSFYFAFGSKDALFQRIVDTYLERQQRMIDAAFEKADVRGIVAALLTGFAELLTLPGQAPGCLLLNNALPIEKEHPFRAEWAQGRDALRQRLEARLRKERRKGSFPSGWDPVAMARLVVAMAWGFAVEAHSGATRAQMQETIDQFVAMWPAGALHSQGG